VERYDSDLGICASLAVTARPGQVAEVRIGGGIAALKMHPGAGAELGLEFVERDNPRTW
jgi:hypothetical protein